MLNDTQCRYAVCPPDKTRARVADAGGLYLEITPAGSKRWFWKFRKEGKEHRLALGSYPAVSLAEARLARDAAKVQKREGPKPIKARQAESLRQSIRDDATVQATGRE